MKVILSTEPKEVIEADAVNTYPHECCGFLFGVEENGIRDITLAQEVDNTKEENRERRFEISPLDYMKAEKYADENNLLLLGVYHSHPEHPAVPSEHDLKFALPWFSYVIASVKKKKIHQILSWRLDDEGKFAQENLILPKEKSKIIFKSKQLKNLFNNG